MQPQQRAQLAFALAMVGAAFAIGPALLMGLMMGTVFGVAPLGGFEFSIILALVGWIVLAQVAGGAVMLAAGFRLRDPVAARRAAGWVIAGGVLAVLGGNMLAAGLGIGSGVLVLTEPAPAAAPEL